MERLLPVLSQRSSIEQVYELLHLYLQRTIAAGPSVLGQILKRSMECGIPFFATRDQDVRNLLLSLVERAQHEGLIRNPTAPSHLLETAFYLSNGVALAWCSKNGKWDILTEYHHILSTLLLSTPFGSKERW